jgi:hypothetical protein
MKIPKKKTAEKNVKKRTATIFLILATFFNPFGFDVIQMILIKLTGSLFGANLILYFLSASCFGLYFLFSGNNPFKDLVNVILTIYNDKFKNYFTKTKN